jgi:3-hydroxyanthranilate 3,4-dioxygenase
VLVKGLDISKLIHTFDVHKWIEDNRPEGERPMMNHEQVWRDGFIVMLFNGATPTLRSDFHINTSPEFFFQLEGDMWCRLLVDGEFVEHTVKEGEMFYIPPHVPHLNRRGDGSIGLVIHQSRAEGAKDVMVWFCDECANQLHRVEYLYPELRSNLMAEIDKFLANEELRTCDKCGHVMPADQGKLV